MLKNMFIREIFSIVVLKSLVLRERERESAQKMAYSPVLG